MIPPSITPPMIVEPISIISSHTLPPGLIIRVPTPRVLVAVIPPLLVELALIRPPIVNIRTILLHEIRLIVIIANVVRAGPAAVPRLLVVPAIAVIPVKLRLAQIRVFGAVLGEEASVLVVFFVLLRV